MESCLPHCWTTRDGSGSNRHDSVYACSQISEELKRTSDMHIEAATPALCRSSYLFLFNGTFVGMRPISETCHIKLIRLRKYCMVGTSLANVYDYLTHPYMILFIGTKAAKLLLS